MSSRDLLLRALVVSRSQAVFCSSPAGWPSLKPPFREKFDEDAMLCNTLWSDRENLRLHITENFFYFLHRVFRLHAYIYWFAELICLNF